MEPMGTPFLSLTNRFFCLLFYPFVAGYVNKWQSTCMMTSPPHMHAVKQSVTHGANCRKPHSNLLRLYPPCYQNQWISSNPQSFVIKRFDSCTFSENPKEILTRYHQNKVLVNHNRCVQTVSTLQGGHWQVCNFLYAFYLIADLASFNISGKAY